MGSESLYSFAVAENAANSSLAFVSVLAPFLKEVFSQESLEKVISVGFPSSF